MWAGVCAYNTFDFSRQQLISALLMITYIARPSLQKNIG
jgi:hypothetical protein